MWEIILTNREKNEILSNKYSMVIFSWIEQQLEKGASWDNIWFGQKDSEDGLQEFLNISRLYSYFDVTKEEWYKFVTLKRQIVESGIPTTVTTNPTKPLLAAPGKGSSWDDYKKKLESKNFSPVAIGKIELSSRRVITEICSSTEQINPIRGMVVGNVQSGKTANMAGVIAMAADYGYNMFIVLSGTIENLRIQTQKRLLKDLTSGKGKLNFILLDNVDSSSKAPYRLQDLYLDPGDKNRYLMVCLKNSSRLRNLLKWICKFSKNKEKLKILVIDDEADQAGINTADYTKSLKTTICALIENLVFGRDFKGNIDNPYKCMNYIGYTATPYANFLNTSASDSLYPRNFIITLPTSDEYFGPKEIFGVPGDENKNGLSIINTIDENEIKGMKKPIELNEIPSSLKDSIIWFLCTVVLFRKWNLKSPVSMLIHTSQRQIDHMAVEKLVENYFEYLNKLSPNEIKKLFKIVWLVQTNMFNKSILKEQYSDYEVEDSLINDFPSFNLIEDELVNLVKLKLDHIKLEGDSKLTYTKGVHLCVDNCYNNSVEDGNHMRIVYPDPESDKEIRDGSPAFIIIGGSTLSRGLTLEGLTVSYFLRGANQADTLMQMGRWFGYRRGYEILPRLWMSEKTQFQFEYLAKLDDDLREELKKMQTLNQKPYEYAARIDKFPAFVYLKITAKNKMQSAEIADFSNHNGQTTQIFSSNDILNKNFDKTIKFINDLGNPDNNFLKSLNNPLLNDNSKIWIGVNYQKVLDYLSSLEFPRQSSIIQDYEAMEQWFKEQYDKKTIEDWHILLSGVKGSPNTAKVTFDMFDLYLGQRSRIKSTIDGIYNLKTITGPADHFVDIDCNNLSPTELDVVRKTHDNYQKFRATHGLSKTPLLIIYIIDKDSKPQKEKAATRFPLNTSQHVVVYDIYIPSDSKYDYGTKVAVHLDKVMEDDINAEG